MRLFQEIKLDYFGDERAQQTVNGRSQEGVLGHVRWTVHANASREGLASLGYALSWPTGYSKEFCILDTS
eukprot:4854619-Pleurochrysis_carterae.AAC.1